MIPQSCRQYFESLHGLKGVLPPARVQNQNFLMKLFVCLEQEPSLTNFDLQHLKKIQAVADQVAIPVIQDVKSYCEAEAFICKAYLRLSKKQIRLTMQWALLLLVRHEQVEADLATITPWLKVWRCVHRFQPVEQGFVSDFIGWMEQKGFSPLSMAGILREFQKLRVWMNRQNKTRLDEIGELDLQRYILDRACGQSNASKQKVLGNLKTVLY